MELGARDLAVAVRVRPASGPSTLLAGPLLTSAGGRPDEVRVGGRWQANSGPALLDASLKGLGLAQLPDYYVEKHLASGELVSVLDHFRHSDTAVWAVYPRHRHLSPKVRQFVDFMVERFEGGIPGLDA